MDRSIHAPRGGQLRIVDCGKSIWISSREWVRTRRRKRLPLLSFITRTERGAAAGARFSPLIPPLLRLSIGVLCASLGAHTAQAQTANQSAGVRVAVVKSLDLPEYNQAQEGFFAELSESGRRPHVQTFTLGAGVEHNDSIWQIIRRGSPDLILAVGTRAAREAVAREQKIPIVYTMVLTMPEDANTGLSRDAHQNLTGATLNISQETQLEEIRRAFPTVRRIGVICDSTRTRAIAERAQRLARQQGLTFEIAWVRDETEVPAAVRHLREITDVLWMLPDQTVLTPRSSRYIIFELIKSGIPVIGLSSAYVKAGALLALECRYDDIGRQSGELAVRILEGASPAMLQETVPRSFLRTINLKVREHIELPMNEAIIKDSNVVVY
jgi:putative ABC transport system substrate-binding protein